MLMALSLGLSAQKKETFTDNFGTQGHISYSGVLSDTILPASGNFDLQWRDILGDSIITYKAKGNLRNHQPHGSWTWEEAGWDYRIEPGSGIKPAFETQGKHHFWQGNFSNGTAHGNWTYVSGKPTVNQWTTRDVLVIKARLKEGNIQNKFTVIDNRTDKSVQITGHCTSKGIADKTWSYTYYDGENKVIEKRTYDRGIIIQVEKKIGNEEAQTIAFSNNKEKLKNLTDTTKHIIIGEKKFENDNFPGSPMDLLSYYMDYHFLNGWEHPQFPFEHQVSPPLFQRLEYLLSEAEKEHINHIKSISEVIDNEIKTRFDYGNLEINRTRSAELDLAIAGLEQVHQQVKLIDSLMRYIEDPIFTYYDRNGGELNHHLSKVNELSKVQAVKFPEANTTLPTVVIDQDTLFFARIQDFLTSIQESYTPFLEQVDQSFARIKREGELKELENQMEEKLSILDSLYEHMEGLGDFIQEKWVKEHLNESVRHYAQIADYSEANKYSAKLLMQMDSLMSWIHHWERFDNIDQDLRQSYTFFVYNPYTGERDMEMKVKKRFVKSVIEHLTPWMLNQLKEAETWNEFVGRVQEMNQLRRGLIRFAQMDERADKRVERRVRREDQPEKMKRLLMNHLKD